MMLSDNLWILMGILFVIAGPFLGGLFEGLSRKITARMQSRIGPPVIQPFYDFFKLMQKERTMVDTAQSFYIFAYLLFIIFSGVLFFLGSDVLLFFFSLTLANTFLILSGYAANSPFSHIGTERELILMMTYEPMMILSIVGMYIMSRHFNVKDILDSNVPLIIYLPGCFVGMIAVMCIKLQKSPFDLSMSHHPHQEIVKGLTSDFSGIVLAMLELAHWYKYIFLFGFIFLFFGAQPIIGLVAIIVVFILINFIDNIFSRFKYKFVMKVVYVISIVLGLTNIAVLSLMRNLTDLLKGIY